MSLFLGGTAQYANATVDPHKIKLAETQFFAQLATFARVLGLCSEKCLHHYYGEGELGTGERACVDRCVSKFVQANLQLGKAFQEKRLNPHNCMPEYTKVNKMRSESER